MQGERLLGAWIAGRDRGQQRGGQILGAAQSKPDASVSIALGLLEKHRRVAGSVCADDAVGALGSVAALVFACAAEDFDTHIAVRQRVDGELDLLVLVGGMDSIRQRRNRSPADMATV